MEKLKDYLKESLLDDEEDIINNDTTIIDQFLKDNYEIDGTYSIKNGVVNITGHIVLKNYDMEYLTNDLFVFGEVTGDFKVGYPYDVNIKSLKGSPRKVYNFKVVKSQITSLEGGPDDAEYYKIYYNDKLKSLKGAPKIVKKTFSCYGCDNLTSLKGGPKEIGGDFDCDDCKKLTSLEGGPEIVGGNYECFSCPKLKSIKGIAKKIGGTLDCSDCTKLSKQDVEKDLSDMNIKYGDIFWQ